MTDANGQAKPKDAARAGDRYRALPGRSSHDSSTRLGIDAVGTGHNSPRAVA
jgi:hypothetical protein